MNRKLHTRALVLPLLGLLGALLTSACSMAPASACAADERRSVNDLVYFGVESSEGPVTAEQWTIFLRDEVTPRFPAGLTTWDAAGQWRSADGSLTHEPAHVLNLVHPGDADSEQSVRAIIEAYKTRYRQEAVLRVKGSACVSF